MKAKDINPWTKEHEDAKQAFIKKYIRPDKQFDPPNMEEWILRQVIWDYALANDHLIWVPAGKGPAYFKYKKTTDLT